VSTRLGQIIHDLRIRAKQQLRKTPRQRALPDVRRAANEQCLRHAAFVKSPRQSGPAFPMTNENF
jgi:hypothetical protein